MNRIYFWKIIYFKEKINCIIQWILETTIILMLNYTLQYLYTPKYQILYNNIFHSHMQNHYICNHLVNLKFSFDYRLRILIMNETILFTFIYFLFFLKPSFNILDVQFKLMNSNSKLYLYWWLIIKTIYGVDRDINCHFYFYFSQIYFVKYSMIVIQFNHMFFYEMLWDNVNVQYIITGISFIQYFIIDYNLNLIGQNFEDFPSFFWGWGGVGLGWDWGAGLYWYNL